MQPNDGRVVSNFIMQALQVKIFQFMVMANKPEVFAMLMI
jgi:hypothetical protein